MYWAVKKDGTFEVIDGQQRTISICQYINEDFSFNKLYWDNVPHDKQKQILDYKLMVYFCEGEDSEKLEWFKTINIAGEKLTNQELRNAVYSGSFVSDAKRFFSKSGCVAYNLASDYINGSPIRQEYLEIAIKWISDDNIEDYMGKHQQDKNADELWEYFQKIISWIKKVFPKKRKKLTKGVNWGMLYSRYKNKEFKANELEKELEKLIQDDDITKKGGIYPYVLTREEKYLSIRAFSQNMKQKVYEKQNNICKKCKDTFDIENMEADHITPWCEGGQTIEDNCQMLCKKCNREKSNK